MSQETLTIKKQDLIELLNYAIYYGGDCQGPYYDEKQKERLLTIAREKNLEIIFEKCYGHDHDIDDIIFTEDI